MEDGVRYDSFGFDWGSNDPILSNRDLSFKSIACFQSPFKYEDDSN
jgi:dTDP-4-dehydrorhamnose 3,5-epimerase/CDP-3, 6-dideoxy-D-glycero-D-glycero-4-hexulose-5-epimerase